MLNYTTFNFRNKNKKFYFSIFYSNLPFSITFVIHLVFKYSFAHCNSDCALIWFTFSLNYHIHLSVITKQLINHKSNKCEFARYMHADYTQKIILKRFLVFNSSTIFLLFKLSTL